MGKLDRYSEFLEEARGKINPANISSDEDGTIRWFFQCLYEDCRKSGTDDELRLAAESQIICEILTAREKKFAIA